MLLEIISLTQLVMAPVHLNVLTPELIDPELAATMYSSTELKRYERFLLSILRC